MQITRFKLTKKGHYVTEFDVFINHWNLKAGTAHVSYNEQEGPVIEAESDDPVVIDRTSNAWKIEQRRIEEERKNNDPVYLREQIALLTARVLPAERQIAAIKSIIQYDSSKKQAVDVLMDIDAILKGYDSAKVMVKIKDKEAKESFKIATKKALAEKKLTIKEARKKAGNKDAIVYRAEWLEYLNGNGQAYCGNRSAKWGRTTQCHPQRISKITADVVITETGKVYVNGMGKMKINLTNYETGEVIRSDYDMSNLLNKSI